MTEKVLPVCLAPLTSRVRLVFHSDKTVSILRLSIYPPANDDVLVMGILYADIG